MGSIIIGKIIFYYVSGLVMNGMKYFQGKPDYKKEVKDILESMSNNKSVISEMSDMIDSKSGMDATTAEKVLNIGYVKSLIIKTVDKSNGDIDETELKNQLKTILIKTWSSSIGTAIEKVKKDLK